MALAVMSTRITVRQVHCWHCAPTQEVRARFEPGYRCAKCAMELDDMPRYTAKIVMWAMANVHRWQEKHQARPELADMKEALEWAQKTARLSTFEQYTLKMRLVDGCSLKAVASRFNVTESAVSRAALRVAKKVAVWLNSPDRKNLA